MLYVYSFHDSRKLGLLAGAAVPKVNSLPALFRVMKHVPEAVKKGSYILSSYQTSMYLPIYFIYIYEIYVFLYIYFL